MAVELLAAPAPSRSARRARAVALAVAQGVGTLLVVSLLIFLVTQAMPGDVARVVLGTRATPETLATLREQLGLDRPIWEQYGTWLWGVLRGDFGTSLVNGVPVSELLAGRIRNSLTLSVVAMLIMLPISLLVGVVAAQRRDRAFDQGFLGTSIVVNATPEFVTGTVLIALLGTTVFHLLPPVSFIPPGDSPLAHPEAMVLPVLTLVVSGVMYLGRLVRIAFIDAMSSEYVQTARLKGLGTPRILARHALPNALGPVIPAASLVAAYTVGGVVVVEYLFAYPGIGAALVEAVNNRDLPVIQAIVLLIAATYYVLNLVADLLAGGEPQGR